jgi:protein-S-isoprenylcysteine O-methyltransferase Ste14
MDIDVFKKWAECEYSKRQQLTMVILSGLLFVVVIPVLLLLVAFSMDQWFRLPRFVYGSFNQFIGLLFIVSGWLFASWSVKTLIKQGKGTQVPMMPTKKLVVNGPYAYSRNPMAFGTFVLYFGIGIWVGSLSAIALVSLFAVLFLVYIKIIEEKELEARFGREYLVYKRSTPFLIPRLRKGSERKT